MTRLPAVSWVGKDGERLFGGLVRWEDNREFAVTVRCGHRCRIHRSNLTFELG